MTTKKEPAETPATTYEGSMIDAYMESAIRAAQRGDIPRCERWLSELGEFLERHPEA